MFAAVAISYGSVLLFMLALRSGRTDRVRAVTMAAQPVVRFIPIVYGAAALAGVAAAVRLVFNLLAPWLVISYVLFIVLTAIGAALVGPRLQRVGAMVGPLPDGPLPDGPLPDDVRAAVTAGGFLWIEACDFIGLVAVIFVMVVKPFS